MPTQPYRVDGKRVPSVTTILGEFKSPGALMWWSWSTAFEVLEEACNVINITQRNLVSISAPSSYQRVYDAVQAFQRSKPLERADYKKQSLKAADAGTLAHKLVDLWIHAGEGGRLNLARKTPLLLSREHSSPLEIAQKAFNSFQAFLKWSKANKFTLEDSELALTSEEHRFGGTIDCIGWLNGELVILDWKTSKAIYSDYVLQLAGYGILWNENYNPPVKSYHLIRFDKETADFHHHQFTGMEEAIEMFLSLRRCYDLQKVVAKKI